MLRICLLFVLALLTACIEPAPPGGSSLDTAPITGRASAIDGDTLVVAGQRIRLHGIDAPELAQDCEDASGRGWACGRWAAKRLAALAASGPVACEPRGRDDYGRVLATCRNGAGDLGAALVAEGGAFAYRSYSLDYAGAEAEARRARRGVWQGRAQPPEAFRAAARAEAAPQDCAIKGNISNQGRLYHLPGSRAYAATRISPASGERWFCTEAEARAAGWRRAGG